ncbi:MAG: DUF1045 domain-containing protein [Acidobacteria bacterium]|nr:DUF1045 domain-containing protein [Acidobacteriota bacterium]
MGKPRYALYYTPAPWSPLEQLGSQWLGRDTTVDDFVEQPRVPGFSPERIAELTEKPQHYGFHATLKAPFELAPGKTEDDLLGAVEELASELEPIDAPPLEVAQLAGFLALRFAVPCPEVDQLAAACVQRLDDFRRITPRPAEGLTPRQIELQNRWGYPYVLEECRFHMTLTDRVSDLAAEPLLAFLREYFEPALLEPVVVDRITIFVQDDREDPFSRLEDVPLGLL